MILYRFIQIAIIPFALIGLLIGIYKEMVVGSKIGISFSKLKILQYLNELLYQDMIAVIKVWDCLKKPFGDQYQEIVLGKKVIF